MLEMINEQFGQPGGEIKLVDLSELFRGKRLIRIHEDRTVQDAAFFKNKRVFTIFYNVHPEILPVWPSEYCSVFAVGAVDSSI